MPIPAHTTILSKGRESGILVFSWFGFSLAHRVSHSRPQFPNATQPEPLAFRWMSARPNPPAFQILTGPYYLLYRSWGQQLKARSVLVAALEV